MNYLSRSRIISFVLAVMLILGLFPVSAFAVQTDDTPPVLNGITLSATSVTAPGTVDVILDATDDLSGVENVYVEFACEEVNESFSCDMALGDDDKFHGVIEIGEDAKLGTYRISFVSLDDGAGNWQEYSKDVTEEFPGMSPMPSGIKNLQFSVVEEAGDWAAPVLMGITLSASSVTAPGTIEVIVDAEDDGSGVENVYVEFACEEVNESFSCDMVLGDDDKFHGVIEIGEDAKLGTYRISFVSLDDGAGNWQEYSKDVTEEFPGMSPMPSGIKTLQFSVVEEDESSPLVLKCFELSATSVTAPGSIEVTVELPEDDADTEYVIYEFYCGETGRKVSGIAEKYYFDDVYRPYPDGKLHGTLEISEYTEAGTFVLSCITLGDGDGNARKYVANPSGDADELPMPDALKELQFSVTASANADSIPPELKGVTLKANSDKLPATIEVIVTASDALSGVGTAQIAFYCEETGKTLTCTGFRNYYDEDTNSYGTYPEGELHGTLTLDQTVSQGVYKLYAVELEDKAENKVCYVRDSSADDTDSRPIPDELKSVQFRVGGDSSGKVTRVYGADRYATSFGAADTLKAELGVEKFDNIVVASGTGFADALAGSYLAAVKNAPILLVRGANVNAVKDYIKANLADRGTVYLLGGVNAVPKSMETGLDSFTVKRLGGATRYDTNLLILQEAGVGDKDIIVCTGLNFADSLSASAAGLPILLVKDGLLPMQKEFLKSISGDFIIVGGVNAVNATVEKQLKTYGEVKRLAGNTRYDTSVLVAKEFFSNPTSAVLAYAQNFPDGLSGGPLAYCLRAPLILTDNNKPTAAVNYATSLGIKSGYVLGGTGLISDNVMKKIFSK